MQFNVLTFLPVFFHCPGKNTFCHGKNPTLVNLITTYKYTSIYIEFHKIGTPLFSFYNFSKCWSIVIEITSLCSLRTFPTSYSFYSLNYNIWGMLHDQNQGCPLSSLHELRECILDEWHKLDQQIIDKVVGEWRNKTLSLCGCRIRTVWT